MNTQNPATSTHLEQIRDQQRATWDKFSAGWKKWDDLVMRWLAPVGEALIHDARLAETDHVLDVAAGTGEPGLTATALVPGGKVVSTDLSERMLAVARENAARRGISNFETRLCDVTHLPFSNGMFDVVLCRFGFMFFPDMDLALREMIRVTRPGARICTAVWNGPEQNLWSSTTLKTIAEHVEMPKPPPGAPGLYRCAAPGFMADLFREAGLKNVIEREVAGHHEVESPEQYWEFMTEVAAPVVAGLEKADAPTRTKIRDAVLQRARQQSVGGRPRLSWSAQVIVGET